MKNPSTASSLKKILLEGLLGLIYPPFCLHCKEEREEMEHLLCSSCLEHLVFLDSTSRCPRCFVLLEEFSSCLCQKSHAFPFKKLASALEYRGPAATLIKTLKYHSRPALASTLAAFMVIQFSRLDWPLPDWIVPVPQSLSHFFLRTFNQTQLLAQEMGKLLNRPVLNALKRRSGDFSQAGLSREKRLELSKESFSWKKEPTICDQTILLVDDVLTTGATIQACGFVLKEGYPKSIYALTCCS